MKKILCIGNSFSRDASRYVWGISRANGKEIKIVNLYIGRCDLSRHYRNMLSENSAYAFDINGMDNTGIRISLKDALLMDDWDEVTVQQQSVTGTNYESFQPYLNGLAAYVRKMCPKANLWMLETWGYEEGSQKLFTTPFTTHEGMFRALEVSYRRAVEEIDAKGLIPCGEAIRRATERGGLPIYRDSFHMSYGFGRYLLGLILFGTLIGGDIESNGFRDLDEPISQEEIDAAKQIAASVLTTYAK